MSGPQLATPQETVTSVARATAASRRAIAELLASGETGITCREIFDGFPDHVEQGGRLVTLRQWHDSGLRDLCFGELFSLRRTGAMRILASRIPSATS